MACMNMNILPAIPTEPTERKAFLETWEREIRLVRRRPSFIIGLVMAAASSLTLMAMTEGWLAWLMILVGVFGVATVYDTVTRHFCRELAKRRLSADEVAAATPAQSG